jgi:hypothetical protein
MSRSFIPQGIAAPTLLLAVFLSLAQPTSAQGQTYGTWSVGFTDSRSAPFTYAYTTNDSGHVLGQYCYPKSDSCLWLVAMSTTCEKNQKYPVLVNSDAGAEGLQVYCAGEMEDSPGKYTYAFTAFDRINEAVLKSSRLGIAIPLANDQFRVIRFELTGAERAVRVMRESAASKVRPVRKGTRDEKL